MSRQDAYHNAQKNDAGVKICILGRIPFRGFVLPGGKVLYGRTWRAANYSVPGIKRKKAPGSVSNNFYDFWNDQLPALPW